MNHTISNYDFALLKAQSDFLKYDISPMAKKYGLRQDQRHTYISFLGDDYRICMQTGCIELLHENASPTPAGYNEAMTIYDVLCYAKGNAELAGEYASVMELKGVAKSANPGGDMFQAYADLFAGRVMELRRACESLGATSYPIGEVACQIPMFDFLPVLLQFWDADDEFRGKLVVKWDLNTLDFMHFETTFYALSCLLRKIAKTISSIS